MPLNRKVTESAWTMARSVRVPVPVDVGPAQAQVVASSTPMAALIQNRLLRWAVLGVGLHRGAGEPEVADDLPHADDGGDHRDQAVVLR